MKGSVRSGVVAVAVVALMACGFIACSGAPEAETAGASEPSATAEEPSMAAMSGEAAEAAGEHREGAEATTAGGEHQEGGESRERGEHEGRASSEHDQGAESSEGEEGGVYIHRTDTWDAVRNGARLVLAFDAAAAAFKGRVENTTASTLCAVRVEVHLSGGVELGPTQQVDVLPGQSTGILLPTGGAMVETWAAHPEISACST